MKAMNRKIELQAQGLQNNIVVELQPGETLIPYCCKMMENNTIPGLLPVRHQMVDGVYIFKYNVSRKVRLHDYLAQNHLDHSKALLLLRNLTDAFLQISEYFLSVEQCMLEESWVYIGDGLRPHLICLPIERESFGNAADELKGFFTDLLSELSVDCQELYEVFMWVFRSKNFDLLTFREKFLQIPEQPVAEPEPMPPQIPIIEEKPVVIDEQPKPHKHSFFGKDSVEPKKAEIRTPVENAGVMNIPGGGEFAIPGVSMESESEKAEKRQKKEVTPKEEKKKSGWWPFGSRSGKEKKTEDGPIPQPEKSVSTTFAAPSPQQSGWEDGTIHVGGNDLTVHAGGTGDETVYAGRTDNAPYLSYKGQKIRISRTPFMMGKQNSTKYNDYAVEGNPNISRNHASIQRAGNDYCIKDENSLNGTFVNGTKIMPGQTYPLREGDELRLYNESFVFHQR